MNSSVLASWFGKKPFWLLVLLFLSTGSLLLAQSAYTNFTIQLGPTNDLPDANPSVPIYPWFPDGHITYLADNGTSNVYQMYWAGGSSYRSLGTNVSAQSLNPAAPLIGPGSSTNDYDNGGAWLYSVYRISPSQLLGFYHAEDWNWPGYSNPDNIAWKSMAYCTSTNNGVAWTKVGQIITSDTPKPAVPTWGGAGDGCVVYDQTNARWVAFFGEDYIYTAISTNTIPLPGTWQKYYNGSFGTPGLGGQETPVPVLSSVPGANPSVSFNTYLQEWVMVWEAWDDSGLYLSTSVDLLNWTPPVALVTVPSPQRAWYGTIIGGTDVESSSNAMLFYAFWPNKTSNIRQCVERTISFTIPQSKVTEPALSAIANQTIMTNTSVTVGFTTMDTLAPQTPIFPYASSSSTILVPNSGLVFGGGGTNYTLKVTPANGQTGSSTITILAYDLATGTSSTVSFLLNVQSTLPTISSVASQSIAMNSSETVNFSVGDNAVAANLLTVTAQSSNAGLISGGGLVFGGSGANRTLTLTPVTGQTGSSTITMTVNDGQNTSSSSFQLTVTAPAGNPVGNPVGEPVLPGPLWRFVIMLGMPAAAVIWFRRTPVTVD